MTVAALPTIEPSGKTLAILFVDGTGVPTILRTVVGAPTLRVNGGAPIALTNEMWGRDSTHSPSVPYSPYVQYPLTTAVPANATATITFPDGTYTTAAGAVAGATLAVTIATGGPFQPAFDASPKTMKVGTNVSRPTNYQVANVYANLMTQSGGAANSDANGYPTGPFPVTAGLVIDGTADPTDTLNVGNTRTGTWTVIWDGAYTANLTLDPGVATTIIISRDTPSPTNVGHTRTYQVTVNAAIRHAPRVSLTFHAAGSSNVRVYPPGEPTDGSELFGADLKRLATGYQCLRFMDSLWTNHSSVIDFGDFASPSQLSFYPGLTHVGGAITSLGPYTEPDGTFLFRPDWCSFIVTFAQPHGAKTGQVLTFAGPIAGPNGNGTFPTTGGGVTQALYNGPGLVRVLDAFRVASHHFASGGGGTLTSTYAQPAGVTFSTVLNKGLPPSHCARLASEVGADAWINVPHAATDACVAAMAQAVLGSLGTGRKCYLEYSNEHWNTGLNFEQNDYFKTVGLSMPGTGATATATVVSGQVTGLTLTNPGAGFVLAPTVTIAPPTSGGTATAHATLTGGTLALVLDTPGNGYSPGSPPAVTIAAAVGLTGAYVWRAAQVHALFATAFTAAGRAGDLVRVMGGQYEFPTGPTANIVNAASHNGITFDALAVAPYYDNKLGVVLEPTQATAFDRLDVDMLHDFSQLAMRYGPYFNYFATHRSLLDAAGFSATQIVCYEGGPQNGTPVGTNDLAHRSRAWARHPRMRDLLLYFLQRLQDSGVALYCDYILFLLAAGNANWGKYLACNQVTGKGDGSDGLFDNRTNYFDGSLVVSVEGGALKTFAALAAPAVIPSSTRHRPRALPNRSRRALRRVS